MEFKGLVSLKEIIEKDEGLNDKLEQYVMLSIDQDESAGKLSKDRQLVIARTRVEFGGEMCRLISFAEVSSA